MARYYVKATSTLYWEFHGADESIDDDLDSF